MDQEEKRAVAIEIEEEEGKEEKEEEKKNEKKKTGGKKGTLSKEELGEPELSAEDQKLKEDLEMLVECIIEPGATEKVQQEALLNLQRTIRESTASMTSVPKPLKFLRPFYPALIAFDASAATKSTLLCDILSVLAMTMAEEGSRESLHFKLRGSTERLGDWGHEYVRNLAGEIGQEWAAREKKDEGVEDLVQLVNDIVPFYVNHNAVAAAADLLIECDRLRDLVPFIKEDNAARVSRYLLASSDYAPDEEEKEKMLNVVYAVCMKHKHFPDALRVALKLGEEQKVLQVFAAAEDRAMKKQLGFILGSQRTPVDEEALGLEEDDELAEIIGNVHLSSQFLELGEELDVKDPKAPEDIYKSHLSESESTRLRRQASSHITSARQNLASSFVSGFVNAGFGTDKLLLPEGSHWLYQNKEHGMLSATASLGLLHLWDLDSGFSVIDKYSFSTQPFVKAGALLATGILSTGVTSEMDAAFALLSEPIEAEGTAPLMKTAAVLGLGIAYAGTQKEELVETLLPLIVGETSLELCALSSVAAGLIFCGSSHAELATALLEAFLMRTPTELGDSLSRLMGVGLGLLFLGQNDKVTAGMWHWVDALQAEATMDAVMAVDHPIKHYLRLVIKCCAITGSGSVLELQKFLRIIGFTWRCVKGADGGMYRAHHEHDAKEAEAAAAKEKAEEEEEGKKKEPSKEEEEAKRAAATLLAHQQLCQAVATLGVAMAASGEALGQSMALRQLDNAVQYGDLCVRRAVPLAFALVSISDPQLSVVDSLSKLTHDQDEVVAIFALGLLGAGTNNSRIATLLRQLATYYAKEGNHLFMVRLAQGLLHMGKGLLTFNPFHSDGVLMNKAAMGALVVVLLSCLDVKKHLLDKRHFLLFTLAVAMRPRMVVCVDPDLNSLHVKVRVGQAVDPVGQAGQPKTITAFQTHKAPVLLATHERAELATDEYMALTPVLEGVVVLKPNLDVEEKKEEE